MQQLSALDSWFLHLEDARMPMHIGAINIFAPEDGERAFNFDEFKEFFRERLHLSPIFRRRLVEVPLNLGRPFWIEDPNFNLDHQLLHVALPKPASLKSLSKLAAQFYNPPMDRTRALWRMIFITGLEGVEGLPENAFATVTQIHHANVDGVSGAEIMATVFDMFPKPSKVKPPKEAWKPENIPSYRELIGKSYSDTTSTPGKILDFVRHTSGNLLQIAKESANTMMPPPPGVMSAPKSILNVPVTPNKIFSAIELDLERVKKLKTKAGVKLNDIVMAICSSGLRRYLEEKDVLPDQPMVAMAPISVRKKDETGAMGNRISGMLVSLATDEEDSVSRLRKIYESTQSSKIYSKATPVDKIVELIPSEVGALATRFYTQMGLSNMHRPFFNIIITNVPGPPIPLFMNGFRMHHQYGLGLVFEGIGLMIIVFSYDGKLTITSTSCEEIMPDLEVFSSYIREGLEELEERLEEVNAEEDYFEKLAKKHNKN